MNVATPRSLNLGCGRDRRADCCNVDLRPEHSPDLVWDLDRHPYPLPRDHFERIFALDVIEHLESVTAFMEEAHALLAPGGMLQITTPHFSCANSYTDPTHRQHLGFFSLDFFAPASERRIPSAARFEIVERSIVFPTGRISGLVARLANRHPEAYERRFAWLWPAWFLRFELRAIK